MSDSIGVGPSIWPVGGIANRVLNAGLELAGAELTFLGGREALTRLVLLSELVAARGRKPVAALVDGLATLVLLVWLRRVGMSRGLVGEVVVGCETVVAHGEGRNARRVCRIYKERYGQTMEGRWAFDRGSCC